MYLNMSSVSDQTISSQNISSKGLFKKSFCASTKPTKDVFMATTDAAAGAVGITYSNSVQKSENTDKELNTIYSKKSIRTDPTKH